VPVTTTVQERVRAWRAGGCGRSPLFHRRPDWHSHHPPPYRKGR
jgi:hypothetical protein